MEPGVHVKSGGYEVFREGAIRRETCEGFKLFDFGDVCCGDHRQFQRHSAIRAYLHYVKKVRAARNVFEPPRTRRRTSASGLRQTPTRHRDAHSDGPPNEHAGAEAVPNGPAPTRIVRHPTDDSR